MTEIYWTKDLLPKEHKNFDFEKLYFRKVRYFCNDYCSAGTVIGAICHERFGKQLCIVQTPVDGFVDINHSANEVGGDALYPMGASICTISTYEERLAALDCSYSIVTDSFTGKKTIKWTSLFKTPYVLPNYYRFDFAPAFSFNVLDEPYMSIRIWKDRFRPKVKDTVSFLFDDTEVKTFIIKNKPIKDRDDFIIDIELTKSDLDKMMNVPVDTIRFDSKSALPYAFSPYVNKHLKLGQSIFKKFVCRFAEALDEIGFKWQTEEPKEETGTIDDACYVYLMVDTANGYHKIGISNKPEYREGTLQSEKPSIELLCAKQFPSRTIAKAIESALHKTYGDKHLRGEWFQLEAKDIIELMAALK